MKKIIGFVFGLLLTLSVNAQIFDGGLSLGGNLSQIDGDRLSGYDKIGFNFGAFVRLPLGGPLSGQLEMKYNNKGAARWGDIINPESYMASLHYVEIPVLLQQWFTEEIFTEFGLSAGYLMGAKYVDNAGALPINPKVYYNKWDYSVIVGINYMLNDVVGANLRWYYSIVPAYEANTGFYRGTIADLIGLKDGYYNNTVSLSVYFKLSSN